jgi:hypothetical protein
VTVRDPSKRRPRSDEPITPAERIKAATVQYAERELTKAKRKRERVIRGIRVQHSAASHLRPFIDDLCRKLARTEDGYNKIAALLEEIADELRIKAKKAHDRIVREVDRVRPMLAKAKRLAKEGIAHGQIDRRVGLTSWIDEVDAEVTVPVIFQEILKPKRHEFWVEAYWLVGKIRDVSLDWKSIKRIYGNHRRTGR